MLQITYLTVEELKSYTPISSNVDTSLLENWIPVSETMHIIPILGVALDSALKTELESLGTLSGNNLTLLGYIVNASAWYCLYEAVPFIRSKITNKSVTQQASDNSQVIAVDDFKMLKQDILDKAVFFRNALIDYLEGNKSLYPLYRSCTSTYDDCDSDDCTSKGNSTGIWV
jgi:hypothetical protein